LESLGVLNCTWLALEAFWVQPEIREIASRLEGTGHGAGRFAGYCHENEASTFAGCLQCPWPVGQPRGESESSAPGESSRRGRTCDYHSRRWDIVLTVAWACTASSSCHYKREHDSES
jgi:hypothetical protein